MAIGDYARKAAKKTKGRRKKSKSYWDMGTDYWFGDKKETKKSKKNTTKEPKNRRKKEDSPWGWRDEPESKPKQNKESFWDKQKREQEEKKSKSRRDKRDRAAERREARRQRKAKVNERKQFFREMKYEGYKITPLGRKMEGNNYRKSKTASEYKAANMKYFSGNRNEEGKYWIKTRKSRPQGKGTAVVEDKPVVERQEVAESDERTKDQERKKFFEEMKHERYELTEAGKRNEKDAYHSAKDANSYRKYVYRMIRDERFAIRVGKSSSTEMEMAAEHCSRDSGTKAGDWFARY
tara:strand:+ start:8676 stop:9557 length:882 start_codon:yes stop_codon:yes gene_type:complete